jgi:hypothetical protein
MDQDIAWKDKLGRALDDEDISFICISFVFMPATIWLLIQLK